MNILQDIAAIAIAAAAIAYALYKIIKFFKSPEEAACRPDKCSSCPYNTGECSDKADKEKADNSINDQ